MAKYIRKKLIIYIIILYILIKQRDYHTHILLNLILLEYMSNKGSSVIKDRCTKEKKEICEKEGKICNPENTKVNQYNPIKKQKIQK